MSKEEEGSCRFYRCDLLRKKNRAVDFKVLRGKKKGDASYQKRFNAFISN